MGWERRRRRDSAREEPTAGKSDYPKEEQKARGVRSQAIMVSRLSTCVPTALLPPGSHVALVTAAAAAGGADLCPLLQRACCSVLTWPADQCGCRHRALQLSGGERVGHATGAHCRLDAM